MILWKLGRLGVACMCHDVEWKCLFSERSLSSVPTEHERGEDDGLRSNAGQVVTQKRQKDASRTCIVPVLDMWAC